MSTTQSTAFARYTQGPAEVYESYFVPAVAVHFATPVVEAAALRPGDRVLDVACGTGVVARLAAERVGSTGTVTAVDGNPGMLQVARSTTAAGPRIGWYEAAADDLPLEDGSCDAVLCSLSLQFFPDRGAALTQMRRVLAPAGRVVVATPGPTPPLFEVMHGVLARHVGPQAAAFVHAVFCLYDATEVQQLLEAAGFADVEVRSRPLPLRLPAPADFFWQYIQSTPLAAVMAGVDAERRQAMERDIVRQWEPFVDAGALDVEVGMTLASARRNDR